MIHVQGNIIIFIHGGCVFPNEDRLFEVLSKREYQPERETKKRRKDQLSENLKSEYEFFKPSMPNDLNASYRIWKMGFEKVLGYSNNEDLILIGHSLGGMFLIKYIGENGFQKGIKQLHLVSSVFDESDMDEDEKYSGDFAYKPEIIPNLEKYCSQIFIYHSTDDDIVPYSHSQKIKSYLPTAKLITLTDRGHINQSEFPELLANIKSL